jgi:hypothetical protein
MGYPSPKAWLIQQILTADREDAGLKRYTVGCFVMTVDYKMGVSDA